MGRTSLARDANVNYVRLLRYLDWLEKKGLVKFVIEDGRINTVLTDIGRDFATKLSAFC